MTLGAFAQAVRAGGVACAVEQGGQMIERFFMARVEIHRLAVGRVRLGGAARGIVQHAQQAPAVGGCSVFGQE